MEARESNKNRNDILLDLNFVPTWARKPPGVNPYVLEESEKYDRDDKHRRHDRGRGGGMRHDRSGGRSERRPRAGKPRRGNGPTQSQGRTQHRTRGEEAQQPHTHEHTHHRRSDKPRVNLPVDIHFIPEKRRLGAVVRQIRAALRAYPLMDVAGLFLSNPDNYLIKIEVRKQKDESVKLRFYQCPICSAVYLEAEHLQDHLTGKHMEDMFEVIETEQEPPSGSFVCVGRCGMSGELLGPPNYHGFEEEIRRLHRLRFSHLSYTEYRSRVEMVHDAEVVEQWKQSACKKTCYKCKGQEEAEEMTWSQAENYFVQQLASKYIHASSKVMVPAGAGRVLGETPLKQAMRRAWTRESHHPFTLSIALRPAFKHMGLHLFKAGEGITFVTAVKPNPIDPSHAIDNIREVLEFLQEHPGYTRRQMAEGLRPGMHDEKELAELMKPLRWLIERGHVLEFFNGTLSVPKSKSKV